MAANHQNVSRNARLAARARVNGDRKGNPGRIGRGPRDLRRRQISRASVAWLMTFARRRLGWRQIRVRRSPLLRRGACDEIVKSDDAELGAVGLRR